MKDGSPWRARNAKLSSLPCQDFLHSVGSFGLKVPQVTPCQNLSPIGLRSAWILAQLHSAEKLHFQGRLHFIPSLLGTSPLFLNFRTP